MATALPPAMPLPPAGATSARPVGDELIAQSIAEAQAALWRAELSRRLLRGVIAGLLGLVVWFVMDQWIWTPGRLGRSLTFVAVVAAFGYWLATRIVPLLRSRVRADYAAASLEADLPDLRHSLTSYVSLRGDADVGGVRAAVLRSIGARAAGQIKRQRLESPSEAAGTFSWWIGLAIALACLTAYSLFSPKNTLRSAQRLMLPLAKLDPPTRVTIRDVAPGNTESLTMRPLEVEAWIDGLRATDEPVVQFGPGFRQTELLTLDDSTGKHRGSIRVQRSTSYRLVAGDAIAGPFELAIRDVPVVSVGSIQITPPPYTGLSPRTSTGGTITAEENSRVTVRATMNRPMQRGRIEFNPRDASGNGNAAREPRGGATAGMLDLVFEEGGLAASAQFPLRLPRGSSGPVPIDSYRIRIWDADGNENPDPIVYPVRIIPDLAPEISFTSPRETVREVPINGQLAMELTAVDPDYGLRRVEWILRRGADPPVTQTVWSADRGGKEKQFVDLKFQPEKLGYRVGDRVLVSAAAEDNREDLEGTPEPNRSETAAIELRIVAAQTLPPASAPENGLSEPDDDASPDGDSGTADGANGSEGGAPGGGQQGADPSEDAGSDGESTGSGRGDGEGSNQEGEGSQPSGGEKSTEPGAGDPGATGTRPDPTAGETPDNGDPLMEPDAGGDAESPRDQDPNGRDGEGSESDPLAQPDPSRQRPDSGEGEVGEDSTMPNGADPSAGDRGDQGQAGDDSADQPPADQPPQHDGDAFERIRDYLERQRQADPSSKPQPPGEQPPGEQPPGDQAAEDAAAGDSPSGDPAAGDRSSADPSQPSPGEPGDQSEGQNGQPGEQPSPSPRGEAGGEPNGPESGDPSASESADAKEPSERMPESGEGAESSPARPRDGAPDDDPLSQPPSGDSTPPEANGDRSSDAGSESPAGDRAGAQPQPGDGGEANQGSLTDPSSTGAAGEVDSRPPDPVDLDYAKQATDLVLDYLNQNRDTPDPELLDRLNWTPEELREFSERWSRQLKSNEAGAADPRQVEEALKSLGLRRPGDGPIGEQRDRADDLRGLRDAGGRRPPPSIHRDAFEAFRQGLRGR